MEVDKQMLLKSSELQILIDSLLESSPKHPLDILVKDPLPSNLVLALFADAVYTKKTPGETDLDYGNRLVLPEGWCLLVTGSNSDWINGYFGAAYVHAKSQQVVVAHRGTILSNTGALFTDAFGILGTQYTDCMNSAVTFTDHIRQVIHSANNQHGRSYNLSITGHSLGGWLAQVTAFTVKSLSIDNGFLEKNTRIGIHATTVVFDSPGARSMLDKVQDVYYDRYAMNVFLDGLNITVYVSSPNRINTCGTHLGKVYRVFTEVSKLRWKDFVLYNVKTHAMSNFVNAFKAKTLEICEVADWAKDTAEYSSLFEILNHANNFHKDLKNDHNFLLEKLHRYNVSETSRKNNEIVKSYLNCFAEDELQILYKLYLLQELKTELKIINDFVSKKNLKRDKSKLFPDFKIDLYNRIISCESRKSLDEVINRLKQLMRWLGPQFTEAVEEQIATFPRSVDLIYRAEGRSYLDSLPKTTLNFNDSIGLREFLLSDTDRVLCIITQDGAFEMSRLQNICAQIIENNKTSQLINKYTDENNYLFLDWSRLQKLIKIYGLPTDQNDHLLIVDCSSSTALSSEIYTFLTNHEHFSPANKLVLFSAQPLDAIKSCHNIKTLSERTFNLMDLSEESQKTLFEKLNLIFTGNRGHSFREFLGVDCTIHELDQIVNSDCLKSIVTNDAFVIKIKDTRPKLGDLQMSIYKINIKTSIECILKCIDSPNTMVVMSGLSREELETGTNWSQLAGKEIILAKGDVELFFKDICNKNHYKSIYLLEVSEGDIYCKQIFDGGFYLPRKFLHRVKIYLQNFGKTKLSDDLFVVSSEEEKTSLLGLIEDCNSNSVYIAATKEEEIHITQIFKNTNIHFVKIIQNVDNGNKGRGKDHVEWRYSHGSVETLRGCAYTDIFDSIDELTLSKTERNMVIIIDEPGMGKTSSLASLSRHIERSWVIYIDLKNFQVHIDRLPEKFTDQNVASFLLSECCAQADGGPIHRLLEHLLQSRTHPKRVVLMFDGFDELDDYIQKKENAKEKLLRLIIYLLNKPTVQIFLTSRKYMKDSLEGKLNQFSTSFESISKEDKLRFLVVFWRSCLNFELRDHGDEEDRRLNEYAKQLFKRAERVLGPNMESFMKIPLQLRMLAEVFRPQGELLVHSLEVLIQQINFVSTPNLFKRFINLKYEIYLQDKTFKSRALDEHEITEYLESITKKHGQLGFKTFFSNFYNANFDNISKEWLIKLNRHGLIQTKRSGEFEFVHRTYAEYCCAQMVVHWLSKKECSFRHQLVEEILLPLILLHPSYKTIRLFMDIELKEKPMSNTALEINSELLGRLWIKDSSIFKNFQDETALHKAVEESNEHIIAFLISGMHVKKLQEAFVSFITQLDISNDTALNKLIGPLMDNFGYSSYRYPSRIRNEVHERIFESIMQSIETCSFELKERVIFVNSFKDNFMSYYYISNLIYTSYDTRRVFERVKQVLSEYTPFFDAISNNNLKLVRKILFKLLKNDVERYHFLVMSNTNRFGYPTALQNAAQCGHFGVFQLLAEQSTVLFAQLMAHHSGDGETLLLTAAGHGSLSIVQYLVEKHRADVNTFSKSGKTTLMFAASEGHTPLIAYLLKRGADVNSVDEDGESALSKAAQKGHLNTVECLVKYGADIYCASRNGQSALHKASQRGHLPTVKFLVARGAEVNQVDQMSRTAVYLASRGGHLEVIRYLLQQGADPNRRDAAGQTALSEAALYKKWSVVHLLVDEGADVNADGGEAIRLATRHGESSVVVYLLDKVALFSERETDQSEVTSF